MLFVHILYSAIFDGRIQLEPQNLLRRWFLLGPFIKQEYEMNFWLDKIYEVPVCIAFSAHAD